MLIINRFCIIVAGKDTSSQSFSCDSQQSSSDYRQRQSGKKLERNDSDVALKKGSSRNYASPGLKFCSHVTTSLFASRFLDLGDIQNDHMSSSMRAYQPKDRYCTNLYLRYGFL